ncbi:MAG: serine/threonine protein kinase, partial [Chlamydiae bacterium]|nr:serine/threonine protein kinase [Chlamydiota bacterium]
HQGKLHEEDFVDILSQIASAIDYAHQKRLADNVLIHRGLKLNNILVGKKEGGIAAVVSDFGLSHVLGEGMILSRTYKVLADSLAVDIGSYDRYPLTAQDPSKLSRLQQSFLQNYYFLAPEQKESLTKSLLTPKVDVYAFGILAYYLLTKKHPEGIFPMPSKTNPHLQLDWDRLISKCLQYNPHARPSSLKELMQELTRSVKTNAVEPVSFTAPSSIKTTPPIYSSGVDYETEPTQRATAVLEKPQEAAAALKPVLKPQEITRPVYEEDPGSVFHLESTVARYIPQAKEALETQPLLTDMVIVPGGEYLRGSNTGGRDERPRHLVRLDSFALDIHPVTNEQFVRFLDAMGGEKDGNNNDMIRLRECRIKRLGGKLIIESGYAKHPVVGVSWYGATAYAKWVGKRLPTEAEWEIASTAGLDNMTYPTGAQIERSEANFFSADTVNVLSYPPNSLGLYDMAGNVYEWCQDWYDYSYYEQSSQEPHNPQGPLQGVYRVLRGGCWKSLQDDLRCSHRHRNNPGTINRTYGFRCAADVK